jgi:amino acid transporter
MLVLGAVGLFFSTFGTIQQYVEGTTGIAIGLLVAGVVVLALALVVARLTSPSRWRIERGSASAR